MSRTARFFSLLLISVAGIACTPARDASTPQARAALYAEFQQGSTVLACTMACSWAWVNTREEMRRLDILADWRELAILVASTGYQKDLAYWYLGRAADGLGLPEAALRYFRQSYALATGPIPGPQCRAIAGDCAGVDLLALLPERLKQDAGPRGAGAAPVAPMRGGAVPAGSAPTLAAVRRQLRAQHEECSVFSINERFRGELPGIVQPVLIAAYHYTECGLGNVSQSTFGIFVQDGGRIRNLRVEPIGEEGVERVTVSEGRIAVDTLTPGPNEGRCCPTLRRQDVYAARGGRLIKLP